MTTINREALLKALQLVRPAISNQTFIPALSHIRFREGWAEAFNDVTCICVNLPKNSGELDLCAPGDLLIKALNSFGTEDVLFKFGKDSSLTLVSGKSSIKVPTLPGKDFPLKWPKDDGVRIKLDAGMLKGIEHCLLSVGSDTNHPSQMGVTLDTNDGGQPVLYSTDNFCISRYVCADSSTVKLPGGAPVILPTFFCQQLLELTKSFPDDNVFLFLRDGSIDAGVGDNAIILTKVLNDVSPLDFESMLRKYAGSPSDLKKQHTKVPNGMDAALVRALLVLGNTHDKFTTIQCKDEQLVMHSTSDMGANEESLGIDADDTDSFIVDPSMVQRCLKYCTHTILKKNALIMTNADATFTHMISHCAK